MPYEFLDDVATADIAFRAWGKDLEETFVAAADATMNVMVENLDSIDPRDRRQIKLENDMLDMLLFNFLQELIYYKDAEKLLLRVNQVKIKKSGQHFVLEGIGAGEKLDLSRHHTRVDVKAVTLHRFSLEKSDQGWRVFVILDI